MPIKAIGSLSGTVADVDGDRNQRVVARTPGLGKYGSYSGVFVTGAIAATASNNATQWVIQNFDYTHLILIEEITVAAFVASTITTAVPTGLRLQYGNGGFSSFTSGTVWTNTNQTVRTGMPTSMATITTNTTTAAGLTAPSGFGYSASQATARVDGNTGTVTGTQFFSPVNATLFSCKRMWGSHPLAVGPEDAYGIRLNAAGPATGTFTIVIKCRWSEVPSGYPLIPSIANSGQPGSLANF